MLWSRSEKRYFDLLSEYVLQLIYFVHQPIGDLLRLRPRDITSLVTGLLKVEEEVGLIKSQLVPLAAVDGFSNKAKGQTIDFKKKDAVEILKSIFGQPNKTQSNNGVNDAKLSDSKS